MTYSVDELAAQVGGKIEGDGSRQIRGLAALGDASANELSFFGDAAFASAFRSSKAGAILVGADVDTHANATLIRVDDPVRSFDKLVEVMLPGPRQPSAGIHPSAVVAASAIISDSAYVGPFCVVGERARIGDNTALMSHVVIEPDSTVGSDGVVWSFVCIREHCELGDRALVHSGVVIGFDGFGFDNVGGKWVKNPQRGSVVIGNDVEIGANVTIARARFGKTRIGDGTKMDADAHIGHNVHVGNHVYVGASCGFGGTTTIGDHSVLAPQSGSTPHASIPSGSILAARAVATKPLREAGMYWGFPAVPINEEKRRLNNTRRLEGMRQTIKELEARIESLEAAANSRSNG